MSEPRCAAIRELAPEVALGVAPVEERARVLEHAAQCPGCRAVLAELSGVADDLLRLTPPAEPPSGFESAVLAQLGEPATAARRFRGTWRRVLTLAAGLVLAAGLSGGAVYWADRHDRELAANLRQTLDTANGQYFAAFGLRNLDGQRRGVVFGYQGDPAWLVLALDDPLPAGRLRVELVARDGVTHRLSDGLPAARVWGSRIPVAVHDTSLLRVLDDGGRLVLFARFARS